MCSCLGVCAVFLLVSGWSDVRLPVRRCRLDAVGKIIGLLSPSVYWVSRVSLGVGCQPDANRDQYAKASNWAGCLAGQIAAGNARLQNLRTAHRDSQLHLSRAGT